MAKLDVSTIKIEPITNEEQFANASAIIVTHNHPSGDATPSKADIDITKKIVEAAETVSITVHDHVIITQTGHYSFKSFGLM